MAQDFAAFARKLDRATAEFTGSNLRQILKQVGDAAAQKDAPKAVAADHGGRDHFSGWPKARFTTDAKVEGDGVKVGPSNKGVGVWRVAQDGRHQNMKTLGGGLSGPVFGQGKISKKTGKALRGKKQTKWNGKTAPQTTWTEAVVIMEKETPARLAKATGAALGKVFRG